MSSVERELFGGWTARTFRTGPVESIELKDSKGNSRVFSPLFDSWVHGFIAAALREQPEARGVVPAGWSIEVDGERVKVTKPDGAVSEWHKRPATNGSGMYDLCVSLTAAQQPVQEGGGARLTNPWTGEPRDYRDVNSDPAGTLCVEPGAPLKATPPSAPVGVEADDDDELVERVARAIATEGFGRQWEDFHELCVHDTDKSDLREYALAAISAITQQPAQAAPGERIMVNAAHDVYTLPLEPSGLRSGPRFVVHVPTAEASADVDAWVKQKLPKSYHALPLVEILELLFTAGVAAEQEIIAAAPTPPGDDAAGGG